MDRTGTFPLIVVCGSIGAGKNGFCGRLADELGYTYERSDPLDNPFLSDYANDPQRWSFHSQMWFLTRTVQQNRRSVASRTPMIVNRSAWEHVLVFARAQRDLGEMSEREWNTIADLFHSIEHSLRTPQLLIHLLGDARPDDHIDRVDSGYLVALEDRHQVLTETWRHSPVLRVQAGGDIRDVAAQALSCIQA